jgi:DNA-binding MarR family transcriptional regulator
MTKERSAQTAALIERVSRLISSDAHVAGLQPVQWEALRYLSRANRFSMTAAAVTAYLGLTKGTVSQTLMALETKGLIRKQIDRKDRRSKRLTLTAKGRRTLEQDPLLQTQAAIQNLSQKSRQSLQAALGDLLRAKLEHQDRQPFGQCKDCMYFARQHAEGRPNFCELLEERLSDIEAESICFEQREKA